MPGDAAEKKRGGDGGSAGSAEAKKGGVGALASAIANTSAGKSSAAASGGGGSGRSTPKAPGSPRVGGRSEIRCVGAGSGGVDEMRAQLNESTVQWGLLRFSIGSGTALSHRHPCKSKGIPAGHCSISGRSWYHHLCLNVLMLVANYLDVC